MLRSRDYRETSERCWDAKCPGRSMVGYPLTMEERASLKNKEAKVVVEKVEAQMAECNNYGCTHKVASSRKKYCSDTCRKNKARADYEKRNPNRKR